MAIKRRFLLFGAACFALAGNSFAQHGPDWRVYQAADGLPGSATISVSLGAQGQALATHPGSQLISVLDGYGVAVFPGPSLASGKIVASPGGQLWAAAPNQLLEWAEDSWIPHALSELAIASWTSGRVPMLPLKQGRVLFLLRDRLMEFNDEEPDRSKTVLLRSAEQTQLGEFLGLNSARDGGVWISGTRGIAKIPGPSRNLKPDSEWLQQFPPASLNLKNFREPQTDGEEGLILLAERSGSGSVIVHFDGSTWTELPVGQEKLRFAWRTVDRTIWAASSESLLEFRSDGREPAEDNEVIGQKIFDVAAEPNGAFWLATSEGLFRHAPSIWQTPGQLRKFAGSVHNLFEATPRELWFFSGTNKLCALESERLREIPLPAGTFNSSTSNTVLWPLTKGFLLATDDRWIHLEFLSNHLSKISAEPARARILGAWDMGVLVTESFEAHNDPLALRLFDGKGFKPWPIPAPAGMSLGKPLKFFSARNHDVWLGCERGVAWYHDQKWRAFSASDKTAPEVVEHFIEMPDERIWCAASGRIWEFDGQHWSVIRGGMDRIRSLLRTADGSVWVATDRGLFRFWQNAWIQNDSEDGLPKAAVQELFEDRDGRLWAATTNGLSLFHPTADPDPPKTTIRNLAQEKKIFEGEAVSLLFDGGDKWKITRAERLLYSCRLDQRDWSAFQEMNTVALPDLAAGKHFFQVRAMDRNGNVESPPARLDFAVVLPWYRELRLVLISVVGGLVALFFAALALNRHRQLRRSYAEIELKVAERTRQLEVANRELFHSQKMNALGTLAAGIAHDFNNILSIVKGSAQIIEENVENPEKIRTRVDRIKTVVDQGSGIVKAMLGFSRESEDPLTVCSVNEVVNDTLRLLGDRFLREVEVNFDPEPELPEVHASKDFIQQILLNLVFNAAEAMTNNKEIRIATKRIQTLPAGVTLPPAPAKEYIAILVRDFGSGISPKILPRIFEPFFTTKALSTRRGTGLGLSMAYELAKKLQAGLAVESVLHEGSTFTLILPVLEAQS